MKIQDIQGRLFQPGFIADIPMGKLVWVDQVNGNDSLAIRERLTIPFKTLTAAKNGAQSGTADEPGDTIVVLPGKYNEKDLLKDRVNWHFLNGAIVKYEGSNGGAIFDSSAGAVTCAITGFGQFENHANTSSSHVVNSATSSTLLIEARSLFCNYKTCVNISSTAGNLSVVVAESMLSPNDYTIRHTGSSTENIIRALTVKSSTSTCLMIEGGSVELIAHRISAAGSASSGAVHIGGGSGVTVVRAYEILSALGNTLVYGASGSAKVNIVGARIKSGGSGADGRAINFTSAHSHVVRLVSCVLVASGDYSIYSPTSSTVVQILNGATANIARHSNVSVVGGDWNVDSNFT